jgi:UDP-N-acetylmuramate dehydrogenase
MLLEENKPLAPLTTFGIGGPARWFVQAHHEADIVEAADWARSYRVPLFVLGGGSNLLVADHGFHGLVLHIALRGINAAPADAHPGRFAVAAGEDWDTFVDHAIAANCAGIECLAGIPGTVGGTPVQNVGAYGQEVASVITRVRAYDLHAMAFVELTAAECAFAYRRSRFNSEDRGRFLVTRVWFELQPHGAPTLRYADLQRAFPPQAQPTLAEVAAAVRRIRQSKGMLLVDGDPDCRSAGSFFKNPIVSAAQADRVAILAGAAPPHFPAGPNAPAGSVKLPAAWLIEQAGFPKGYTLGRAGLSSRHTLALINRGHATAADILALAEQIQSAVYDRFAVTLECEPVLLGF